jgi:hypothetical protein
MPELTLVNVPDKPTINLGTEETEGFVKLVFKAWEVFVSARADGQVDWKDALLLVNLPFAIIEAINGVGSVPAELQDLTDEEIARLVALGNGYNLAGEAEKAKAAVKGLLTLAQTISKF